MSRPNRSAFPALALIGAALIAACGGSTASGAPSTSGPAAPSGAITVDAKEYSFTPSTLTAPAGDVSFSVRNAGTETHEFEVFQGETSLGEVAGGVPVGQTKPLTLTLAAGSYTFKCMLNGHDQLGMTGTLTIQ